MLAYLRRDDTAAIAAAALGLVGDGAGSEFLEWRASMDLPAVADVIADPSIVDWATARPDQVWAVLSGVVAWASGKGTKDAWMTAWGPLVAAATHGAPDVAGAAARALGLGGGLGSLEPIPDDTRLHGAVRYVSHDEDTGDKLYNREIQDTLAGLVKDATIDVIGFDACLMSMLETAYALRDSGSVMVSSEELEPGDGWSYDNFLQPLVADPAGTDAAGLGSLMVEAYRKYYGDRDATTLSAIDLTKAATLADAVSRFATTAIPNLDTHMPAITRARNACENYAPGYGLNSIDLGRFLDQLTKAPGVDNTLAKKASTAKAALEDLVIANYASTSRQGAFGSEGLAIYFPKSQLEFNNDADHDAYQPGNTHYPVEFVDKQKWSNFMHSYLAQAG